MWWDMLGEPGIRNQESGYGHNFPIAISDNHYLTVNLFPGVQTHYIRWVSGVGFDASSFHK